VTVRASGTSGKILRYDPNEPYILAAPAAESIIIRTGTTAGASKISFRDYGNTERASISDVGAGTFASMTLTTDLAVADGGTGLSSYAVGDLLYASGATTLAKLADVAVGSYLRSGGVTTAPLWSTLLLPNAATAFRLPVATAANTIGELAAVGATGEYAPRCALRCGQTVPW
jgi:hypothetical protein